MIVDKGNIVGEIAVYVIQTENLYLTSPLGVFAQYAMGPCAFLVTEVLYV